MHFLLDFYYIGFNPSAFFSSNEAHRMNLKCFFKRGQKILIL